MSADDVEEFLEEHAAERLRLIMSSGDVVIIEQPLKTIISGLSLWVQMYDNSGKRVSRARIVSIPNINVIEPVRPGPIGRSPRRRPR